MYKLIKTINKFNGNLCFVGSVDISGTKNNVDVIFECDSQNRFLSYDYCIKKHIVDVCLETATSYFVAFSDDEIGRFKDGFLDEHYIEDIGISNVDKITSNSDGEFYILNKTANQLVKYDSGIIWTTDLPDYSLRANGNITLRESDGCIIYNNGSNVYVIRDDTTNAVILNSLDISGSGDLSITISQQSIPAYSYVRARTVSGSDLEQSSSSSSSSTEIRSSSSSSTEIRSSSSSSSSDSSSSSSNSIGPIELNNILPPFYFKYNQIGVWATLVNNTGHISNLVAVSSVGADDELFAAVGDFDRRETLSNCAYYTTGIGSDLSKCGGCSSRSAGWVLITGVPAGATITLGLWNSNNVGASCGGLINWS